MEKECNINQANTQPAPVQPSFIEGLAAELERFSRKAESASEESMKPQASEKNSTSDENTSNGKTEKWQNGNNQNAISPNCQSTSDEAEMVKTDELPTLPDEVFEHLPSFLKECVDNAMSVDDRDIILLGTLCCISACFHNVRGVYDGRIAYPNFYLFVVADAGMGKGALTLCSEIVKPIDRELHAIAKQQMKDYKEDLSSFARSKGENRVMPEEPGSRMLVIPANSSASSFLKILNDNFGQGLLFETEGDTLSQTLHSDYGNYSDVLRKAFHHEPVSQSRRKDNEFIDVDEPCLSVALSGTPEQVNSLVPNAENGLLSRFCFYNIPFRRGIRDVFAITDLSLSKNAVYRQLGERFKRDRDAFIRRGDFTFLLPPLLRAPFTDWLRLRNDEYCDDIDNGMQGVVRRVGLVVFRIMMLLSVLREFGRYTAKELRQPDGTILLECHTDDYYTAISIADTLLPHISYVYSRQSKNNKHKKDVPKLNNAAKRRKRLFDALPDEFTTADYDKKVKEINEVPDTATKWISVFIKSGQLKRAGQGHYIKVKPQITEQKQMSITSNNQQP